MMKIKCSVVKLKVCRSKNKSERKIKNKTKNKSTDNKINEYETKIQYKIRN